MKKSRIVAVALVASLSLSACVPIVIAGAAAVGAMVGSDPRRAETIKTDFDISARISAKILDAYKDTAHVNVNAYNGIVLLTGEVPNEAAKQKLTELARTEPGLRKLYNETVVAPVSGSTDRLNDTQLTARVKTAVWTESSDSGALHLMVVTERKVVYLMGITRPDIVDQAARSASMVDGVAQVVKLAEANPVGPADEALRK
ncbi:BON domain-containing protein [Jeongeupia naejangsanensis]|uniref:BON domain-containing protein n=1 Tax=Jeongeupia naejangsanensis TaxID=613195 RepID=A0ABS2BKE4_9NEIS|nr:BON domain-containing protein [Jeongeupia naejangsanensis]MBM3116088.1 BON domain-containing protein [Jeongeupia naejangsanensis]